MKAQRDDERMMAQVWAQAHCVTVALLPCCEAKGVAITPWPLLSSRSPMMKAPPINAQQGSLAPLGGIRRNLREEVMVGPAISTGADRGSKEMRSVHSLKSQVRELTVHAHRTMIKNSR